MSKLIINVDLDSIVCEFMPAWLDNYNKIYNGTLTIEDMYSHNLREVVAPDADFGKLFTEDLFLNLKPLPGAIEALKELNEKHIIHIVTAAAAHYPKTASAKLTWCLNNLPFIDPYMFTLSAQKHLIDGDIIIDDRYETIKKCKPEIYKITIEYPWNRVGAKYYDLYIKDYKDPAKCWSTIVSAIK